MSIELVMPSNHLILCQPLLLLASIFPRIRVLNSWQIVGETVETVTDFIFRGSKITADGIAAIKLKDAYSLEGQL